MGIFDRVETIEEETDPWAPTLDPLKQHVNMLNNQDPWTSYQGDWVSNFNGTQNNALENITNYGNREAQWFGNRMQDTGRQWMDNGQNAQNYYNNALNWGAITNNGPDMDMVAKLADNPYMNGMIDSVGRDVSRNLYENQMPGIAASSAGAGQTGSSRRGAAEAIASRGAADRLADTSATLRGSAYDRALGIGADIASENAGFRFDNRTQGLQAAGDIRGMAQDGVGMIRDGGDMRRQGYGDALMAGDRIQAQDQAEIDAKMAQYMLDQQLPYDQAQAGIDALMDPAYQFGERNTTNTEEWDGAPDVLTAILTGGGTTINNNNNNENANSNANSNTANGGSSSSDDGGGFWNSAGEWILNTARDVFGGNNGNNNNGGTPDFNPNANLPTGNNGGNEGNNNGGGFWNAAGEWIANTATDILTGRNNNRNENPNPNPNANPNPNPPTDTNVEGGTSTRLPTEPVTGVEGDPSLFDLEESLRGQGMSPEQIAEIIGFQGGGATNDSSLVTPGFAGGNIVDGEYLDPTQNPPLMPGVSSEQDMLNILTGGDEGSVIYGDPSNRPNVLDALPEGQSDRGLRAGQTRAPTEEGVSEMVGEYLSKNPDAQVFDDDGNLNRKEMTKFMRSLDPDITQEMIDKTFEMIESIMAEEEAFEESLRNGTHSGSARTARGGQAGNSRSSGGGLRLESLPRGKVTVEEV